jgi:ATP-dependent Clp protease ATP-binding subunit ClpC
MEETKKIFNPEFINRIDEVIVFHRLTDDEMRLIVDINVAEVMARLQEKGIDLVLSEEAKDYIVKRGSDDEYGARPLRRAVQQFVEDPLSEQLLTGAFEPGSRIVVQVSELTGDLMFNTELPVAESIST